MNNENRNAEGAYLQGRIDAVKAYLDTENYTRKETIAAILGFEIKKEEE